MRGQFDASSNSEESKPAYQLEIPGQQYLPTWTIALFFVVATLVIIGLVGQAAYKYLYKTPAELPPQQKQEEITSSLILKKEVPDETVPVFQKSDQYGFFGTLRLTGYLDIVQRCGFFVEECNETFNYVFFVFTETNNELINDFLDQNKGNSFVKDNAIGLGCYQEDKNRIYSTNDGDDKVFENIISNKDLENLLLSNESNLIKLQLTKPIYTSGRGAPDCYSHFRQFKTL